MPRSRAALGAGAVDRLAAAAFRAGEVLGADRSRLRARQPAQIGEAGDEAVERPRRRRRPARAASRVKDRRPVAPRAEKSARRAITRHLRYGCLTVVRVTKARHTLAFLTLRLLFGCRPRSNTASKECPLMVRRSAMLISFLLVTFGLALGASAGVPRHPATTLGQGAQRRAGRAVHAHQREGQLGRDHDLRRDHRVDQGARQERRARRRRPRLRLARRLPRRRTRSSAPSSAATATASAARSSPSTARPTRWPKNNGANTLHGGVKGFDKYVWKAAR